MTDYTLEALLEQREKQAEKLKKLDEKIAEKRKRQAEREAKKREKEQQQIGKMLLEDESLKDYDLAKVQQSIKKAIELLKEEEAKKNKE